MGEVFYDKRHHTSRPYPTNYRPHPLRKGRGWSLLSLPWLWGAYKFKERWGNYQGAANVKKCVSMYVSPDSSHVAVAVGNQITILRNHDDYKESYCTFYSDSARFFTSGAWSECCNVLGVCDETGTLYFLQENGEELIRVRKGDLKWPSRAIGLLAPNVCRERNCLCNFIIFTSDGFLHHLDISKELVFSVSLMRSSQNQSTIQRQFPSRILCWDHCQDRSLIVVIGVTDTSSISGIRKGYCHLIIWHVTDTLDLELLFAYDLGDTYCLSKDHLDSVTNPKVLISPRGKYIATLDLRGYLDIFMLDAECCTLLKFPFEDEYGSGKIYTFSNEKSKPLMDIKDFTWWSDCILVLASSSGRISMVDITSGMKVLNIDIVYSMPILERVQKSQGHVFLLVNAGVAINSPESEVLSGLNSMQPVTDGNLLDVVKPNWNLISFMEISVAEKYDILISNQKSQEALDFADRYRLDKDAVFKSQWIHSKKGVHEINLFLSKIQDQDFVLAECIARVGPTEESAKALLYFGLHITDNYNFSHSSDKASAVIWNYRLKRLKLLQYRDKLETFVGINMGRFSDQEYQKFCDLPIREIAISLAESGKIGALNLLFKRHPYTSMASILKILASVPETLPVQTYGQLLPGRSPPSIVAPREKDWVECEETMNFIKLLPDDDEAGIYIKTEPIVQLCEEFFWPTVDELCVWYKTRARDIDICSGQLENCLSLLDYACAKGISELQYFHDDILYLYNLVYSDRSNNQMDFTTNLVLWEPLSEYDKFKMMLMGVKEEYLLQQLQDKAIPFMRSRFHSTIPHFEEIIVDNLFLKDHEETESYLVRWLVEMSSENKLDTCLMVIEEGCRDLQSGNMFIDEGEAVYCAVKCIYSCTHTDRWSTMSAILLKLLLTKDGRVFLRAPQKMLKLVEDHIEAGRLLAYYQVPKQIKFFLEAHLDEKGVKHTLRLMLSKFIRRQPVKSDNDWAKLWRDFQCLHERAFPFLDIEYILVEFSKGLLKAGRFSLARNYLKGSGLVSLPSDKSEHIVIQSAREYFFSASSLACPEIWKARECLSLLPDSRNVKAEADMIEALTVKLPDLGLTLLPVQFRHISDRMEIIKMAVRAHPGAFLHVEELIEIGKLFGLNSDDDICIIEEAIAREAAVSGDMQIAFDLCISLTRKGHGAIWDLCAAIARGPTLENMNVCSRMKLLGFALNHCDCESIGELLHAWKDLDLEAQYGKLMAFTRSDPTTTIPDTSEVLPVKNACHISDSVHGNKQEVQNALSVVCRRLSLENFAFFESSVTEDEKIMSFSTHHLPWLLELSRGDIRTDGRENQYIRMPAMSAILSWLVRNCLAPSDDLIASLAKLAFGSPYTKDDDIVGCCYLVNLVDAFNGVQIIEEQLGLRQNFEEVSSIINVGVIYSLIRTGESGCNDTSCRRRLMLGKIRELQVSPSSDKFSSWDAQSTPVSEIANSSFWKEWKLKLEQQRCISEQCRTLEQLIPGVEANRFLSGDTDYIKSVVFSAVESVKFQKKNILNGSLKLANTHGLPRIEVLQRIFANLLLSDVWSNDDIIAELSEIKGEIYAAASESINTISSIVYPAIDGSNKQRLALIYHFLADFYSLLDEHTTLLSHNLIHYYSIIAQEAERVSFLKELNFKNIAGLDGLNFECFNSEVRDNINESSVDSLAKMVEMLVSSYDCALSHDLMSSHDVYMHYILNLLSVLENDAKTNCYENPENLKSFIVKVARTYNSNLKYIDIVGHSKPLDIMESYSRIIVPSSMFSVSIQSKAAWCDCLVMVINFWIMLCNDMCKIASLESSYEQTKLRMEHLIKILTSFRKLVTVEAVSPICGWGTVRSYVDGSVLHKGDVIGFCKAMILSGCDFHAVSEVFFVVVNVHVSDDDQGNYNIIQNPRTLYLDLMEAVLDDLSHGWNKLHNLLSSLGKLEGNLEELMKVRHAIWERLSHFSANPQLPYQVRMIALDVMLCLSTKKISSISDELVSIILPWDGWEELPCPNGEIPSGFASTQVALKSSQMAAAVSPDVKITPEDLSSIDSATSCFSELSMVSAMESQLDVAIAILQEWDKVFVKQNDGKSLAAFDIQDGWDVDGWDLEWENFEEEDKISKVQNKASVMPLHPLHLCWEEVMKKLSRLSQFENMLNLLDKALLRSYVLISESGAQKLNQLLIGLDYRVALKMALLLPYESIKLQCLDTFEDKLRDGLNAGSDHEFLVLLLSSGLMPVIIERSCYGTTFTCICYFVGNLTRQLQEFELSELEDKEKNEFGGQRRGILILFRSIILPCFVAELVRGGQLISAAYMVSRLMRTSLSFSLINVAEASLRRYLRMHLEKFKSGGLDCIHSFSFPTIEFAISRIKEYFEALMQTSISSLDISTPR